MGSVGSTLNAIYSSLLSDISSYLSTSNPAGRTSTAESNRPAPSDRVDLSQLAQLFQQFKELQSSDPAELKKVLTDAASKLRTAAQQQSDPSQASFLSNLADRFQKAADTGDLSALRPDSSASGSYAPHRHHPHHHGSQSAQSSSNEQDLLATLLGATQPTPGNSNA